MGERGGENLKKGREEKKVKRVMGAGKRGGSGEEGEKEGKTYLTERPYAKSRIGETNSPSVYQQAFCTARDHNECNSRQCYDQLTRTFHTP